MPDEVFCPRADAPAVRVTLGDVATELGVLPAQLVEWIVSGCLPAPDIVRGEWAFSSTYALSVRCNGIRFPGTYSNALPTYAKRKSMLAKAERDYKPWPGGRKKGSCDKKPRSRPGKRGGS